MGREILLEFIQTNSMILFATIVLVTIVLSELLAHDNAEETEIKKRFNISWILSITGWVLGLIFTAVFVTTI